MSPCLKSDFRLWPLLIFVLLILSLSACSAGNPSESVKTETTEIAENTVSEEKSPLGRWGAILPLPEGKVEGLGVGTVYRNSSQEIIISYSFGPRNARTTYFFNFSTGGLETECKDAECSNEASSGLDKLAEEKIPLSKFTSVGGGIRRRVSGGPQISTPNDEGYETLLPDGTVRYEKIISLLNKKFESLRFRFFTIDANFILGLAINNPVVVVFNNNLTSPFFENNKTLIKMDGNLADSIYRICSADARMNNNTGRAIWEAADACFAETIKDGVSDELKSTVEKKLEQFYVNKESGDTNFRINGEWGMFLPLPEKYDYFSLWGVYLNAEQEIVILYSLPEKEKSTWCVFNLSRGIMEDEYKATIVENSRSWEKEKKAGLTEIKELSLSSLESVPIGEGFGLKEDLSLGSYALKYGGYEVISPNGDVRYEKIVWISPEKHEYIYRTRVATDEKAQNYIHAESNLLVFYQLDEKTLIVHQGFYGNEMHAFIVFRNDMTSPYLENHPSLIPMDGKRVDSIYNDCISYKTIEDVIENTDKCFIEFLKSILLNIYPNVAATAAPFYHYTEYDNRVSY